MDIDNYLKRISYQGPKQPVLETLQALHLAHLLTVPFENLDIHYGRQILLDDEALWTKIIEQRRGGFCYELNGMFAWLLRSLGFDVSLHSANVANAAGEYSPDFDHLALLVHLDENWLVDVGFGESFRLPLVLQPARIQEQKWGNYRFERDGEYWIVQEWDEKWRPAYRFTLQPYHLSDFAERCIYHQTSPESHFRQKRICTLATPSGRITLSNQCLITTTYGKRTKQMLNSEEECTRVLAQQFGVEI